MKSRLDMAAPIFVPADKPERFAKAALSGADAVILDLEDAVAPAHKDVARNNLQADFTDLPVIVRINGVGSPWHDRDIEACMRLPLAAVMLPKAELSSVRHMLGERAVDVMFPLMALVETARGIADARSLAGKSDIERLVFGSIDYSADLGCAHTREALLAARSELVVASRLGGILPPIDGVTTSIEDGDLIESDARYAVELGFGGKLVIHPRQVEAVRRGFRPSDADTAWSSKVLASNDGAARVDGAMVDEPVRMRARAILARAMKD